MVSVQYFPQSGTGNNTKKNVCRMVSLRTNACECSIYSFLVFSPSPSTKVIFSFSAVQKAADDVAKR